MEWLPIKSDILFSTGIAALTYLAGNLAKSLGPDVVNAVRYAVASLQISMSVDIIESPNDSVASLATNTLHRIISQ